MGAKTSPPTGDESLDLVEMFACGPVSQPPTSLATCSVL